MIDCLSKIIAPRRAQGTLWRHRLVDFLHQHVDCRLQVISAGAGYGKTTLLVDFAQDVEIPVCWYSLDKFDSDPKVFLETLTEAILHKFPDFGGEVRARMATLLDPRPELPAVVRLFCSEIYQTIPEYFALVLDDYHQVEGSLEVNSLMEYLLERLPDNCQLIISSRHSPPLSGMPKLVSQQRAAMLATEDLSFTAEEVKELHLLKHGIQLSDDQAQELVNKSGGWPTALQLMGSCAAKDGLDRQIQGSRDYLFDYLTAEVYLKQPKRVRQFLIDTSILTDLEPAICNYLLGISDSAQILQEVERANLFVLRKGEDGQLCQYHHLFQDFLEKRLAADKGRYTRLNLLAATAYKERGSFDRAVEHYQKANAWDQCISVLSNWSEHLAKAGRWESLARWVDAIPHDSLKSVPQLMVWRAQAAIRLGQMDHALALSSEALAECQNKQDNRGMGQAALVRAAALRLVRQPKAAMEEVRLAITALRGDPLRVDSLAEAHRQQGLILYDGGKFEPARKEWQKALALSLPTGNLFAISRVHDGLGIACAELGDFGSAFNHFEQAKQGWQQLGNLTDLGRTLSNLGELYCVVGNYGEGLRLLWEAVEVHHQSGNVETEGWTLWNIGDAQKDLGNLENSVKNYQKGLQIARQCMESQLVAYINASLGTTYGLQGRFDEAETLIRQAISQAEDTGNSYDLGLFLGAMGNLCCLQKDARKGLPHIAKSVELISGSKNPRMEAWARLLLANGLFLRKRFVECQQQMEAIATIVQRTGYDGFLAAEAARMPALIQYATSKRLGGDCFLRIREKALALRKTKYADEVGMAAPTAKVPPRVEAFALGKSEVLVDGRKVSEMEWRSRKSKELFYYLLSHRREGTKEQILDALWPEISGAKGHSSFYSTAYRLRRALYDGCLRQERGRYYLSPDGEFWFDVEEFRDRISTAGRLAGGSQERASRLERAVALYRGPFLEEFYSEWCETLRRELEHHYISALARLAGYYAAKGDYARSVTPLERIIEIDPYREEVYAELMKACGRMGNAVAALKWYEYYCHTAGKDLGATPSQELTDLYRRIRKTTLKPG
jgi:ATP/maltotriose-dependent transcriptional regulator MalT/DNA-binding SARP family transcriptional activator